MNQSSKYSYKTIVVFLQTRAWTIETETKYGVFLTPPNSIQFSESDFRWFIPKISTSTYNRQMELIIQDIATMYDLLKEDLMELFARPYQKVKREVTLMKDMLLYA